MIGSAPMACVGEGARSLTQSVTMLHPLENATMLSSVGWRGPCVE